MRCPCLTECVRLVEATIKERLSLLTNEGMSGKSVFAGFFHSIFLPRKTFNRMIYMSRKGGSSDCEYGKRLQECQRHIEAGFHFRNGHGKAGKAGGT